MLSVNALVFCDRCRREGGKTTLEGVFTSVVAREYPLWQDLHIWMWFAGPPQTAGQLKVICWENDAQSPWFRILLDEQFTLHGDVERIHVIEARFCFPRPATYLFQVLFNNVLIAERKLRCDRSWWE